MSYQSILDSPYFFTAMCFLPLALISLWVLVTPVKAIVNLYPSLALVSLVLWTVGGIFLAAVTCYNWVTTDYGVLRVGQLAIWALAMGMMFLGGTCNLRKERLFRFLCVLRVTSVLILLWLHVTY